MLRYLLLLAALLCFGQGNAQTTDQNYPVTAQAFVVAQPNQKLATFFSSNRALTVSLLLKDLTKTSVQAYLRWSIDGPGVHIASIDGHIPAHFITLQRGIIQRLSGQDLQSDYFLSTQILAEGLAGPPLRTSLPEGFYTFRIQALEAGTGREVSNWGETYFSITTPLPPVINIPFNGAELIPTEAQKNGVQSVNIQWMPRHYRMPGNVTSYDLLVCKIPDGYEPTEALDACVIPIIDDKGNPGTFYPGNTGIGNSSIGAWEVGEKYAVRVAIHEFDANGDEILFANEGRSEVTWFRFGKECISPRAFEVKDTGPGRVQLTWRVAEGITGYQVLYRKTGATQWTQQEASGTTTFIANLVPGEYEFAIKSNCSKLFPDNIQSWEIEDETDDWEDLPLALTDPMQLPVQTAGCTAVTPGKLSDYYANFPGEAPDSTKKLTIPTCALQSSTYTGCSDDHPVITPPTTGTELTELKTGDVLGIYDFTVFVAEATAAPEGFAGKGFVRMPFLEGALVPAEFSGVKVWKSDGNGGCVYESARFESKGQTQAETAEAMSKLMTTLAGQSSPNTYAGTLAGALQQYDELSGTGDSSQICQYKAAVLQASEVFKVALEEAGEDEPDPRITAILQDLETITSQLQADSLIPNLTQKYKDLFAKLELLKQQLQEENTPPDYQITNIQLSNLQMQSAKINWQLSGGEVTRYVVEYRDPAGATLIESLDSPQVNLQRLKENTTYSYTILAYQGDKVVATSAEGQFTTLAKQVPRPENLAYTILTDKSVKITWDKNTQHKDFKLVYTDGKGNWQAVFPTTNEVTLTGLDPSQLYDYEIVAYNNARVESAAASARVTIDPQCAVRIIGPNRAIQGYEIKLEVVGCELIQGNFGDRLPEVIWESADLKKNGRVLGVKLQETTTFKATCYLPGSNGTTKSCTDEITVVVEKRCEGVVASAKPTTVSYGDPVLLKVTSCQSDIKWKDSFPNGKILGEGNNLVIHPLIDRAYTLSCLDSIGKQCWYQTAPVTIDDKCENFNILLTEYYIDNMNKNKGLVSYYSVGCPVPVVWDYDGKYDGKSDGSSIYFANIKDKNKFNLTAKCGQCSKTIVVGVPSCLKDAHIKVYLSTDQSRRNKIIQLNESERNADFWWADINEYSDIRVVPIPTGSPEIYTVVPKAKNAWGNMVTCDPIQIGINPVERLSTEPILDCIKFALNISPSSTRTTTSKVPYFFIPSGCTDGFNTGKVYWDDDEKDIRKDIGVFTAYEDVKHKATCVIGDLKIEKEATLKVVKSDTDPINRQYDWGFQSPDWGMEEDGTLPPNTGGTGGGTSQEGDKCNLLYVSSPSSVTKGKPFSFAASCNAENSFVQIEDRQSSTGNKIYEQEGSITLDLLSNYFDYAGINYDWTKPIEFRVYCLEKSTRKQLCHKYVKIPVSCSLSVTFGANNTPIVKGCEGQSLVLKYFLNGQSSTIEKATHYKAECHTTASYTNIWCSKEGALPNVSGRLAAEAGSENEIALISDDCIHLKSIEKRVVISKYLQRLLCDEVFKIYGVKQSDSSRILPHELASTIVNTIKGLENSDQFKNLDITLAPVTEDLIASLVSGNCDAVIQQLTSTLDGALNLEDSQIFDIAREVPNVSLIYKSIDSNEVIDTDFITRYIQVFESEVQMANARVSAIRICPEYYFDPTGKRIHIPGIDNCVVSINGILMSFEKEGEKYIPLIDRSTTTFIGYHKEADFAKYAKPSDLPNARSAPRNLLTQWLADMEYPKENSGMSRWIDFIEENKERPGVILNYSDETFKEVKLLFAQLPEFVFDELEGSESYFLFDLLTIKQKLQEILSTTDAQIRLLFRIFDEPGNVCTQESKLICKVFNCVYNSISGYQKRDLLNARIPLATRKLLLALLAENNLSSGVLPGTCTLASDGEGIVLSLLKTTPEPDRKAVLDYIKVTTNGLPNRTLLKSFVLGIDGDNFISFISTLSEWILKAYPRPKPFDIQTAAAQKRFLHFNDNWLGSINREEVLNDGTVRLTSRKLITGSDETYEITADPYDYILVTFENDFGVGESRFVKGEPYVLPAIYVYLLFNEDTWQAYKTSAEVTVMVGLTALGISEIAVAMEAGSVAGLVAGTIDLGLGIGDVVLSIAFKNEVDEVYPELADTWSKIAMCYGVGRLAVSGVNTLYRKAYVESRLVQYDFRISDAARQKARDMSQELQKPENFAEFANDINPILDDLADLRANNWVKGRRLSSESVNIQLVPGEGYPPYKFNTFVDDIEIGVGEKIYCVEYLDVRAINSNWADQPGGWMGTQLFNSEAEVRDALALLPEFKKEGFPLVIREYEVIKPIKARKGIVGGLKSKSNGKTYHGGGEQIQILDGINRSGIWEEYFKKQDYIGEGIRNYIKLL